MGAGALYDVVEWIPTAMFQWRSLHVDSFHLCAFFVSCVLGGKSVLFPHDLFSTISYVFRIFLGLQHLYVTTGSMFSTCFTRANVRKPQKQSKDASPHQLYHTMYRTLTTLSHTIPYYFHTRYHIPYLHIKYPYHNIPKALVHPTYRCDHPPPSPLLQ